ncbi:DM13 domain-containing protein [Roseovarius aquimarinus]|uniref:DM13 domain-containing protein n=1 Tax=Roseovarius aquimarinus TaxID=1229156 RepID=A0ABW7I8T9_9RHOB
MNRRQMIAALAMGAASLTAPMASADKMAAKASGTFTGLSNHVTTGGVSIIEEDGRIYVELAEDFSLDGGPDPRVHFGKGGAHDAGAYLGALVSLEGKQRYAVPPTWDVSDYNEVYIWCEVASVPLGVAGLE